MLEEQAVSGSSSDPGLSLPPKRAAAHSSRGWKTAGRSHVVVSPPRSVCDGLNRGSWDLLAYAALPSLPVVREGARQCRTAAACYVCDARARMEVGRLGRRFIGPFRPRSPRLGSPRRAPSERPLCLPPSHHHRSPPTRAERRLLISRACSRTSPSRSSTSTRFSDHPSCSYLLRSLRTAASDPADAFPPPARRHVQQLQQQGLAANIRDQHDAAHARALQQVRASKPSSSLPACFPTLSVPSLPLAQECLVRLLGCCNRTCPRPARTPARGARA